MTSDFSLYLQGQIDATTDDRLSGSGKAYTPGVEAAVKLAREFVGTAVSAFCCPARIVPAATMMGVTEVRFYRMGRRAFVEFERTGKVILATRTSPHDSKQTADVSGMTLADLVARVKEFLADGPTK